MKKTLYQLLTIGICLLLMAVCSFGQQKVVVLPGSSLSPSAPLGAWGGTGYFYSPTFNVNAPGGIDITYYDIDVSLFTEGNIWSLKGVALPGVSKQNTMTSIDPQNNSVWCNILNMEVASGVDWNANAVSTLGPDGTVRTNDDTRHQGTQDWYRKTTGDKVDGPAAGPYYNNESYVIPNPRFATPGKTASELNSYDFRLRILPTGVPNSYTYEMWFRMHNSAATYEGAHWIFNKAMNNSTPAAAWRAFTANSDGSGSTVFPIEDVDLSSAYVFMGLGNFQDPATQSLTWGRIEVTGTPTSPPSVVWVDDNYIAGGANDGHVWGYDAFAKIQDGVNAVATSGTVNVAAGTYNQDEANGYDPVTGGSGSSDFNIFVNKSVTIQGVTAGGVPITHYNNVLASVIPKRNTPLSNLSTFFVQADNVTISGLDITAFLDPENNFKTISIIGNHCTIKYCKLHNLDQVSSIYMYDPRYVPDVSYLQSYDIENNYLDAGGIHAAGIRMSSGTGWTGDVSNRVITRNTFNQGSYGIEFVGPNVDGWDYYPVGAATISSNTFTGQEKGSLVAWGKYAGADGYGPIDWNAVFAGNTFDKAVLVKTLGGQVRYYDQGTFYNVRGIYSAIQRYPLNKVAQAGDIVTVAAGTYTEAVNITTEGVKLLGASGAIVKPDNSTPLFDGTNRSAIYVNAVNNITIDGFTIDGTAGVVNYGIYAFNSNNSAVTNNTIHEAKNNAGDNAGVGILFFGWGQGISGALADGNTVYNCDRMGVFIGGMETVNFKFVASGGTIQNNTVYNTWQNSPADGGAAVQINAAIGSMIQNNKIHDTKAGPHYFGIYIDGSGAGNKILGNEVYKNTYGVVLWTVGGGVDLGTNTAIPPEVHLNGIYSNTTYGLRNVDSPPSLQVNATCNYWGSPSGPTHSTNPGGSGDRVSDNVTFYPWLGEYPSQVCGVAKYEKSQAIGAISSYQTIPPAPNKDLRDDVKEAIKKINESLGAAFWAVAPNRLTAQGAKMFDKEKDAVKRLRDEIVKKYLANPGGPIPWELYTAALDAIQHLLTADNILASVAIADAQASAPFSPYLAAAKAKFAKALDEYSKGRYPEAIDRYKEAWQNAMNALKNAGVMVQESPVPTESGLSYGEGGQEVAPGLDIQTALEETSVPEIPTAFSLGQNYPNPFNPATTIQFALPTASFTTLKIFNLQGQEVAALVNAVKNAGTYTVRWNAAGLPSGVYFYQLRAGSFSETKRLILQK